MTVLASCPSVVSAQVDCNAVPAGPHHRLLHRSGRVYQGHRMLPRQATRAVRRARLQQVPDKSRFRLQNIDETGLPQWLEIMVWQKMRFGTVRAPPEIAATVFRRAAECLPSPKKTRDFGSYARDASDSRVRDSRNIRCSTLCVSRQSRWYKLFRPIEWIRCQKTHNGNTSSSIESDFIRVTNRDDRIPPDR